MSDNPRCSEACRRPVKCGDCGRTKKPLGRDAGATAGGGHCDSDCEGYSKYPQAGHLWPSELIGDEREPTDDGEERA